MAGTFISYRHDDSAGYAGRLYDDLCDYLGAEQIFRDIDTLQPGEVFPNAIEHALRACDVLIAVIGRHWLTSVDTKGQRRLQDPRDYVRQEIEAALRRRIHVIPVLVQGATMPEPQDLPDSLKPLTERHALTLSDSHWKYDIERLTKVLGKLSLEKISSRSPNYSSSQPKPWSSSQLGPVLVLVLMYSLVLLRVAVGESIQSSLVFVMVLVTSSMLYFLYKGK